MEDTERIVALLTEIRDGQREHLEEYRRISEHAVHLQETAVTRYRQMVRVYLAVGAVLLIVVVFLIAYLFALLF